MSVNLPAVAVIGAGSMGGAILQGLRRPEVVVEGGIRATNRTEEKAAPLRAPGVLSLATEADAQAQATALRGARIVLLGVKPVGVPGLLEEIAPLLEPDAVVVSIAAGVRIATIEARVSNVVLRAMPNTPSLVGRGVTGVAAGPRASREDTALVRALFETVGSVVELPEERIDALSTISGSGPAYVFFLIERLTETAQHLGFDGATARLLVEETFRGASELLAASDVDPAELRRRVTSPHGTTERAIAVLEDADLTRVFDAATAAALVRAHELANPTA
ncbi:pyrroline-5-carboxylate reductase [Protaetiibacter larvae]|uniref:Pyrroline-5-carboxylate reductase n=1 Tax=Protaetiibacter larvae TaxID=2592654 RepID=A0A5C1Y4Z4_9MICO|nr:pyrroline-5-carboxylate reductase [Protaetiibacter larvae]QEO08846.1 pyrroline-5-carboxylate reductase [Protaetiibacter larvae]